MDTIQGNARRFLEMIAHGDAEAKRNGCLWLNDYLVPIPPVLEPAEVHEALRRLLPAFCAERDPDLFERIFRVIERALLALGEAPDLAFEPLIERLGEGDELFTAYGLLILGMARSPVGSEQALRALDHPSEQIRKNARFALDRLTASRSR